MKHVVYFLSGVMIFILTIMLLLTLSRKTASDVEVADSVHHVLETTVENVLDEKRADYAIDSKEEFIADFTESLLATIDTASDIEVSVYEYDPVAGILSVKVKETYKEPDGSLGTAECTATVIVDYEAKDPLPDQISINMHYIDVNGQYKSYKTMTVREGTKLSEIEKPSDALADGAWVYDIDYSAVSWGDASNPGLEITKTMSKLETTTVDGTDKYSLNLYYNIPSGLYGTDGSYTTWQQLKAGGYITVSNGVLNGGSNKAAMNGKLVIDPEVKSIKDNGNYTNGAFYGCSGLTAVACPRDMVIEARGAFCGCQNLVYLNVPKSTSFISDTVSVCRSLRELTFPDGLTTIGWQAMQDCSGLIKVTLPSTLKTMDGKCFQACTSLTGITIPDSIVEIGNYNFIDCSSLASVTYKGVTYTKKTDAINALKVNGVTVGTGIFDGTAMK